MNIQSIPALKISFTAPAKQQVGFAADNDSADTDTDTETTPASTAANEPRKPRIGELMAKASGGKWPTWEKSGGTKEEYEAYLKKHPYWKAQPPVIE